MRWLNLWFSDGKCFETVPYIEHKNETYIKKSDVVKMLNQVEQWPPHTWGISFTTLSDWDSKQLPPCVGHQWQQYDNGWFCELCGIPKPSQGG